ncbi:MAG TPA: glycerol kinase GlpK [Terriglobales bacterium]|nr:glycerol kinase GlpK [Terriglobales bacterium]
MKRYIGAIDQGTTSTRFLIFDHKGRIVSAAQKEHRQIFPQPGWVEHDPVEILQRTREVMAEAIENKGLKASDLAGIGITNQRETTIVWERKTGSPVCNAIVWQDMRVADEVARFAAAGGQDRYRAKTGLPLSTYFSGLKLRWILQNVVGTREKAANGELLFGNVDTFLLWNLTGGAGGGVHATDVTNASRTQLMNLNTLDWDAELLADFEIPHAMLPTVRSSSEVYGEVNSGPLAGTPIAGILGDQQAALVGQACFAPGEVKNTYGTGCFLLMNTGEKIVASKFGLLTTVAYKLGHKPANFAMEGSVAITGALVQWLRDNLGLIRSSDEIETLARTVEDNGDVYFVPAFSGLYAPYWKETARGVIAGLTRFANKGHLARAALEATAYQTRDVAEAMEKDAQIPLRTLRVDGGMVKNELLMQFQADLLDREVVRPEVQETTSLGAAYAAGLAVEFFAGLEELRANWRSDRTWKPKLPSADRQRLYAQWKKAVSRSFDWAEN